MDFSIETKRLLLRPFTSQDVESYFKITRDFDIKDYVSGAYPESIEVAQELIEKYYSKADFDKDYYLLIEEKSTQEVVGAIMMNQNFSMKDYGLAYFVSPNYRRKGYMKEALNYFLKLAKLPSQPIHFIISKQNTPSLNLIKNIDGVTRLSSCPEYSNFDRFIFDKHIQ